MTDRDPASDPPRHDAPSAFEPSARSDQADQPARPEQPTQVQRQDDGRSMPSAQPGRGEPLRSYGTPQTGPPRDVAAPLPGQARYADADGRLRPDPAPDTGGIRDPGPLGPGVAPEPDPGAGPVRRRPPVALTGPPVPRPGMPDALGPDHFGVARADRPLAGPETEPTAKLMLAAAIACSCYGLVLSFLQWKSIWWVVNTPRSPDLHPLRTDVLDVIGLVATGVLTGWALLRWAPGVRRRLDQGFRIGPAEWVGVAGLVVGAVLALVWFGLVAVAGFGSRAGHLGLIPTGYRIGGLGVLLAAVGWWCVWRDRRPPPSPYLRGAAMAGGPAGPPGMPMRPPGPPPAPEPGPPSVPPSGLRPGPPQPPPRQAPQGPAQGPAQGPPPGPREGGSWPMPG